MDELAKGQNPIKEDGVGTDRGPRMGVGLENWVWWVVWMILVDCIMRAGS